MIMQLKNTLGVYSPLDVFEDFDIFYNHQYEDASSIGGKKIPYTNKFKIPLTETNRELCGIPFDATYPLFHSNEGRMLYTDGSVAFYFIADIEGQTINVLQPYIDISIIDNISKAIGDLSKWKMSDLFAGDTINFTTDSWFFGNPNSLTVDQSYVFPYFNFNNKTSLFAYDSKRKLTQLQPTFIVHKLLKKIFDYVGVSINSDFLNLNDQLATGINADDLGLMIPLDFRTIDDSIVTTNQGYAGKGFNGYVNGYTERIVGVPSVTPTSTRLTTEDFLSSSKASECLKLNFDWRSDEYWDGTAIPDPLGKRWCSTVNGKLNIISRSNNTTTKPYVLFGKMWEDGNSGDYTRVISTTNPTLAQLDIMMVKCNMERRELDGISNYEVSQEYDVRKGQRVGYATYEGIVDGMIKYEMVFDSQTNVEFDVEANEDIELGLILVPNSITGVYSEDMVMTSAFNGTERHNVKMQIRDGYTYYEIVDSTTFQFDIKMDMQTTMYSVPTGVNQYPTNWTISFNDYTGVPSGFSCADGIDEDTERDDVYIVDCDIDMSESMKSVKDYSLIDILKMIMDRFNLQFYSDSSGLIWVDTEANRMSNEILNIDHLIDAGMDVDFTYGEDGILSINDDNPSFYEDDFNRLDKQKVSETKRGEYTKSFSSAVVNPNMFEDVYDPSGYDLLKYINDTNYWGTADRKQEEAKSLRPTFCFLKAAPVPVYFPYNLCAYSWYETALEDVEPVVPQIDFGFYNSFKYIVNVHPLTFMTATNFHATTGFNMVSFAKDVPLLGTDNLYQQTWYRDVISRMDDESVIMNIGIYVDENTFKTLLDYPTVRYKGQDWIFKGFNNFPLSAQDGGITEIKLIKKEWN